MFMTLSVMILQVFVYVQTHQIAHIKYTQFFHMSVTPQSSFLKNAMKIKQCHSNVAVAD